MSLAKRMFAAAREKDAAVDALTDEMLRLGIIKEGGWEDVWVDDYDTSIEISGLPVGVVLSSEQQAALWSLGFERCWTHDRDEAETYYSRTERASQ